MTGFGSAEDRVLRGRLRIEIRTVNHRYFNPQLKLPGDLAGVEIEMRERLRQLLERGHVAVTARWVEVCFCATPLEEERPYWEEFFELISVKDAHARRNCRHENGTEPWACCDCDCTKRLQAWLRKQGDPFKP